MKKVFLVMATISLSVFSYSQCNTRPIDNRKYEIFKDAKERNTEIHILVAMYNQLMLKSSKSASEMNVYIKSNLAHQNSLNIQKYIDEVVTFKKMLITDKQSIEMNKLDKLLFCYYTFLEEGYKKMQKALKQKDREKLINEYQAATRQISLGIDEKYNPIPLEMKYLFNKYPL